MIANVEESTVVPITRMKGDDEEDTELLREMLAEAKSYVRSFTWCKSIREEFYGNGVGGVVAVFLFRIEPGPGAPTSDEWLWVVTGDLPPAYLVTDRAHDPHAAVEAYCGLMEEWIRSVRAGKGLDTVFPVAAEPTLETASLVERRIAFLRQDVMPILRPN